MKKRLITCCGTCPFADDGTDNDGKRATVWTCHGEYDENGWPKELGGAGGGTYPPVAPPDWCVLRRGPVLIKLSIPTKDTPSE
jgi:hypothetical protein